jgi:hypothetical protein
MTTDMMEQYITDLLVFFPHQSEQYLDEIRIALVIDDAAFDPLRPPFRRDIDDI